MILLFPCRHCFASQTSNNYDFWSEYPKPAAFAIIIADTAMNPQISHYFQPKYVSYRSKNVVNFDSNQSSLGFLFQNSHHAIFAMALEIYTTIFSLGLCSNTLCNNLHGVSVKTVIQQQSSRTDIVIYPVV